jgi:hypothetical protein
VTSEDAPGANAANEAARINPCAPATFNATVPKRR